MNALQEFEKYEIDPVKARSILKKKLGDIEPHIKRYKSIADFVKDHVTRPQRGVYLFDGRPFPNQQSVSDYIKKNVAKFNRDLLDKHFKVLKDKLKSLDKGGVLLYREGNMVYLVSKDMAWKMPVRIYRSNVWNILDALEQEIKGFKDIEEFDSGVSLIAFGKKVEI